MGTENRSRDSRQRTTFAACACHFVGALQRARTCRYGAFASVKLVLADFPIFF